MASELLTALQAAEKRRLANDYGVDSVRLLDEELIVQAHLAALKRAQEEVAYNRLKAIGFEDHGDFGPAVVVLDRGTFRLDWDSELGTWYLDMPGKVDGLEIPKCIAPENMQDVADLIARLTRNT